MMANTKLTIGQQRDLELLHTELLDAMKNGPLCADNLYNWLAAVNLWAIVARSAGKHAGSMWRQQQLAEQLVKRYVKLDKLNLTVAEYDELRDGVRIMRTLASRTTQASASAAANAGESQTNDFLKEI